jgi:hypothetical protein
MNYMMGVTSLKMSDFNYGCLPQLLVDKIIAIAKKRGWSIYYFRKMRHVRKYGINAIIAAIVGLFARALRRR